jgi:hypothetical protein
MTMPERITLPPAEVSIGAPESVRVINGLLDNGGALTTNGVLIPPASDADGNPTPFNMGVLDRFKAPIAHQRRPEALLTIEEMNGDASVVLPGVAGVVFVRPAAGSQLAERSMTQRRGKKGDLQIKVKIDEGGYESIGPLINACSTLVMRELSKGEVAKPMKQGTDIVLGILKSRLVPENQS